MPVLSPAGTVGLSTVTTTTTVTFAGPEEAGYSSWPPWTPGYDAPILAAVAARNPGFWDRYPLGHEPRTYTFTETLGYSAPGAPALIPAGNVTSTENVLMGFTYNGLQIPLAIEESLDIAGVNIFTFKAGFDLNWGFGLRLPAEVSLSGPAAVADGDTYRPSAVLTPLDWSADDYTNAGVAPWDGNEYVFKFEFFIGVKGTLLGFDICPQPPCPPTYWEQDIDQSASFATPLGPGSAFPVGTIPVEVFSYELPLPEGIPLPFDPVFSFTVNLNITPQLGSSGITADWRVPPGSDVTGSGTVTFTSAGTPVELGTVTVGSPEAGQNVRVELSNFRYAFDQFLIGVSAGLDFQLFGYGLWNQDFDIYTFDLSALTQITGLASLSVGAHTECTWDFNCAPSGPDNVVVISSLVGGPGSVAPPPPLLPLCADFDGSTAETIRAHIPDGTVTGGSVFCRSLVEDAAFVEAPAEIGNAEVLAHRVLQAVDVFGLLHNGSAATDFNVAPTICLRGSGALYYLDATVAPRALSELPSYAQSGYTCGSIPNAGTVVLVDDLPSVTGAAPGVTADVTPLNDCMVTTLAIVNLRAQPDPGSDVLRMVPYNVTLTAFERSADWFYVDYIGSRGWVNARFVTQPASCQ
jgi:hypothetical protein